MNNSIIDLLIRIKNGYLARKEVIESPYSAFKEQVLIKLKELGYVQSYEVQKEDNKKYVTITLKYEENIPAVTNIRIFSRPGKRWYVTTKELRPVLGGLGYAVVSTPKGILTSIEAKKEHVAGELLFEIW